MTDLLQQLQDELSTTTSLHQKLTAEAQDMTERLAQRKADLQKALIAGLDEHKIVVELSELQIKFSGMQRAIVDLDGQKSYLSIRLTEEKRILASERADTVQNEYREQADVVYTLLSQALEATAKLRAKSTEYWKSAKEAGAMDKVARSSEMRMLDSRTVSMQAEIKKILADRRA